MPSVSDRSTRRSPTGPLEVYLLGTLDFDEAQLLQRRLVYDFGERDGGGLVLCEHPPTISVGRAGSRAHILADDELLRDCGISVRWVNRGGGCVLHVPGQLAAYLIMPLQTLGLDLRGYLDGLTHVVLDVLAEFDLRGTARADALGVCLGGERVATIGVAVRRWIAYYGIILNVGPFLGPFDLIVEPGLAGSLRSFTSMEARRQRPTPMPKVREALIRRVEAVFGLERHVVFTSHPLIGRTAPPHALASICP
jgi:lipoyl(octanoyl) transferase